MADIEAFEVRGVGGVSASDDKQHALLKLNMPWGEAVFAVRPEHLRELLHMVLVGIAQTSPPERMQPAKLALEADWWEAGKTQDGRLMLSFRAADGAELSFVLDAEQMPRIRETLQAMEGDTSMVPPSNTPRN